MTKLIHDINPLVNKQDPYALFYRPLLPWATNTATTNIVNTIVYDGTAYDYGIYRFQTTLTVLGDITLE